MVFSIFRRFLPFATPSFIHFIQNNTIASANSENIFLKKRQNYQPFSEIIPFVQSGSLLLLATCSSFFPPSLVAIVCLTASWRLNSQGIYHFLFVKVLSYFIKREVLGLFCGESAALPPRPHFAGAFARRASPPLRSSPVWALRPIPRPTFSRRGKWQHKCCERYARDQKVPGPPAQGGGPPWIPPPPTLAVLVVIT